MKRSLLFCAVLFLLCANIVLAQEKKTIAGIVQDEKGSPLVGVSVQEKNTSNGTLTDQNGAFRLSADPEGALIFTYIGFLRQEVPLNGRVSLALRMQSDSRGLNEVVVTAMGIKKERRKLGYAVSNVSGEDIQKANPTNFASALYGKAAGVTITTAPGGSTSASVIRIRGLNTISLDNQPLIVVDGVPLRSNEVVNNGDMYSDGGRIRGNGLLDINPDNIQDVSILKGAAAAALYGSSGSNGVVLITTKQGAKRPGIGVDVNYSFGVENATQLPEYQTEYGPGYYRALNLANYGSKDGWISVGDVNNDGKQDVRPPFRAYGSFGPKFDGRDIYYWDGTFQKYNAHPDNLKNFYQTGFSSIANVAISSASDKGSVRFAVNRQDYKGVQIGGKQEKNSFNLNLNYKFTPRLTTDIAVTYVNEFVHNRPARIGTFTNSYSGFFSPADDVEYLMTKYQTSKGYKYVDVNPTDASPNGNYNRDPDEAFKYSIRATSLLDFLWNQLKNSYDEKTNRVISSFTMNYEISKNLKFRGRFGNDFTGYSSEEKRYAEYPIAFGASGAYAVGNNQFSVAYGDAMLTFNKDLSSKFSLNASAGYQVRRQDNRYSYTSTTNGLVDENMFSLNATKDPLRSSDGGFSTRRTSYLQDGAFGILGIGFRNFLFLEGTGRYERVSTLAPGNNAYFYPSVSLSWELTRALHLPNFIDYSKLRASYGVTATPPDLYRANIVYTFTSLDGKLVEYPAATYGNNELEPEFKHEIEFGWETKMFENRLGIDVSYYNNIIKGQIINLTIPSTTGAKGVWMNVGDLNNYGVEAALYGTPITSRNFEWNVRGTIGYNKNKLKTLRTGLDQLLLRDLDNGSLLIVADVNRPAGDIYTYDIQRNEAGTPIIGANGLYQSDFSKRVKVGNIQPDLVGGLNNSIRYKDWTLDFLIDYRWGGQIVSPTNYYQQGAGMLKSSMQYRDAANGGLSYYEDAAGNRTLLNGGSAPAGTTVYHDGVILDGVDATGKKNEKILEAAEYYFNTFTWGNYPNGGSTTNPYSAAVFDNNYVKLREVALNYTLPVRLTNKARLQRLTVGIFGRNLFYLYKSLPNLDPEVGGGTSFVYQGLEQGTTVASRTIGANLRLSF